MKHPFKISGVIILLFVSSILQAQNTAQTSSNNNSLLWEITGNGLAKLSYLFGTYHMMCKEQFVIKEKVLNALHKSDGIVAEINLLDSLEKKAMQQMMISKRKLTDALNEEQQQEMNDILKGYGLNLKQADNFSITLLYSLAAFKSVNCAPASIKMIDMELMTMADSSGKSVDALETLAGQTNILGKAYGINDVMMQMKNAEANKQLYAQLAAAYIKEDIVLLDKLLRDPAFMNEAQEKLMLTERNNDWVKQMPGMMKNKSLFFAVGAGHLWGKEGVINLLKQKGYTVQPVFK